MNIIKKVMIFALLGLSVLTTTSSVAQTVCSDVITYATNPVNGICMAFPTPCDVPAGWQLDCPVTTTTTTTRGAVCYRVDGSTYYSFNTLCGYGTAYTPPPPCPGGTLTIPEHMWVCTPTTVTTTTVTTTTTTTLKNRKKIR